MSDQDPERRNVMFPGSYYRDDFGYHYRCLMVTGHRVCLLRFGEPVAQFEVDWAHTHRYKAVDDPRELEYLEREYRRVQDIAVR